MLLASNRLLPSSGMHHMSRVVLGIPQAGLDAGRAYPLTTAQRAMVFAAKVLPQPVVARLASLAMRLSPSKARSRREREQ